MRTLTWTALLAVGLAGCGATEAPPSISTEAAPEAAPAGHAPMESVPEWLAAAAASPELVCYLDVLEGAPAHENGWRAGAGDSIRVAGWAVDKGIKAQGPGAIRLHSLTQGGKDMYFAAERSERADVSVAPQFAALAPTMAGLTSSLKLDGVASGQYEIFYVIGDAGRASACSLGMARVLTVG